MRLLIFIMQNYLAAKFNETFLAVLPTRLRLNLLCIVALIEQGACSSRVYKVDLLNSNWPVNKRTNERTNETKETKRNERDVEI